MAAATTVPPLRPPRSPRRGVGVAVLGVARISTDHQDGRSLGDQAALYRQFLDRGIVQFAVYGYVKPPGATTDADLTKDPAAEPVYAETFRLLEAGAPYAEVADWLNAVAVPVPPYARLKAWDGRTVGRLVHN